MKGDSHPIRQKENKFSIRARIRSIAFAFDGLIIFFKQEHNAWIHLFMTIIVFVFALVLKITKVEAIILCFSVGLVWMAELFNTAIERTMDLVSLKKDPRI